MMQRNLKQDVLERLDGALEFLPAGGENAVAWGYDLTHENPVITIQVPGGYRIVILNTLSAQEQAELIAHELGHLLLQSEELYSVSMMEDGPEVYLTQEMNNVIFHHFIIERLAKDYGIGSSIHFKYRKKVLERIDQLLAEYEDESILLYGLGLHLLDLSITTSDQQEKITEILEKSPRIKRAFELGQEWLVYPHSKISVEEQWKRISNFVQYFGYDPIDIRLRGGLGKVDEDDDWE